ncbi:MAG: phosphoenolpyruvate carboxylase [Gammaproteobacteria bacterium]|nr:phosphoenolpyruvate carboxylase [Gammaproteobacteria bacterium]
MRADVRTLGSLLGEVIADDRGNELVDRIEEIRALAKRARGGGEEQWDELSACLKSLPEEDLVDVARGFNQFLNLANIAEQRYHASPEIYSPRREWARLLRETPEFDPSILEELRVELVLTAHPTEVLRRTMIRKYDAVDQTLQRKSDPAQLEILKRLIAEIWHTDEVRQRRPSPLDEAKWGFAVIENSLWDAVPRVMRAADEAAANGGVARIPPAVMPIRLASWMGGDRDGNPNVTAEITDTTLKLARWMSADLFLRDIQHLVESLSMAKATPELLKATGQSNEPYRVVLRSLRQRLHATRDWAEGRANESEEVLGTSEDLLQPLELCYRSLCASGLRTIADGALLDTIRRAHCFGITLVALDVRQHAERHTQVFDELLAHLNPKSPAFSDWEEKEKQVFLLRELENRRPLFPRDWPMTKPVREVLDTFDVIANTGGVGIGTYIISMATRPSDVLQVALLLRARGLKQPLPIAPLFETLDDLQRAPAIMQDLFALDWYRSRVRKAGDRQQVMIGYSDSAKDAGPLAAAWALYQAQEGIARAGKEHGVHLTLFHGRGGAIGRGGGPAHDAILAQPPGTVDGSLRVTEQGEMIRFKLGSPVLAVETMTRYLIATLKATIAPASPPSPRARQSMDEMAARALHSYRKLIDETDAFVPMFQALTPERELADLALGSRPSRRKPSTDINSLRAIPWVFAWSQVRLMIPAWLGSDAALYYLCEHPGRYKQLLQWPFFRMQMDLLELMAAKAEPGLGEYYASRLTGSPERELAETVIERLSELRSSLLALRGSNALLADQPLLSDSLAVRNTYLDPLHLLQAELLHRSRQKGDTRPAVSRALKITLAGIASGLRNSG